MSDRGWDILVARDPEASVLWDRDVVPQLACEPSYVAVHFAFGPSLVHGHIGATYARAWIRSDSPKFYDHCFAYCRDPVARWERLW